MGTRWLTVKSFASMAVVVALALAAAGAAPAARADAPVGMAEAFPTHCGVREIVAGPGGDTWFTCFTDGISGGRAGIGRVTPTGEVSEFNGPIPENDEPAGIVLGADGNLWFTLNTGINLLPREQQGPAVGRVTPSGEITIYQAGLDPKYGLGAPVAGPEGDVWFTTAGAGKQRSVASISPSGQITEHPVTIGNSEDQLGQLAVGADGNLWFTNPGHGYNSAALVRLAPGGAMTEFGAKRPGFDPAEPVAGPDGNLWFLEASRRGGVGRITPGGQIAAFRAGLGKVVGTTGLLSGPGGDLWFASQAPPLIGRVTTSGQINRFSDCLRYGQPYFGPKTLIAGPDGNVWFTSITSRELPNIFDPPSIGRITPSGAIAQIYGGVGAEPRWIAAGADGAIWFSGGADEIQRIVPFTAPVNTFRALPLKRTAASGATLARVVVAGPGTLAVKPLALVLPHGKTVGLTAPAATAQATACGTPAVRVKPVGAAMSRFRKLGRVTERFEITFTPTGGTPYSELGALRFVGPRRDRHRR
jgi:streptogramin lyase